MCITYVVYAFCFVFVCVSFFLVFCRRKHVLFTLFVFLAHSGVRHILCCAFFFIVFVLCTLWILILLDICMLWWFLVRSNTNYVRYRSQHISDDGMYCILLISLSIYNLFLYFYIFCLGLSIPGLAYASVYTMQIYRRYLFNRKQSGKSIAVLSFFLKIQAYAYQYKCWYINALRQIEPCMPRLINWCLMPTHYHDDMILLHSNVCSPPCHMIIYFVQNTMNNSRGIKHHYSWWQIGNNLYVFYKDDLVKVPYPKCIDWLIYFVFVIYRH